jgi:hypothetical protein
VFQLPKFSIIEKSHFQCSLLTSGALTLRGLAEGERRRLTIGVDFADTAQTAEWTIKWGPNGQNTAKFQVQVKANYRLFKNNYCNRILTCIHYCLKISIHGFTNSTL